MRERLQKILAEAGVASRRAAEKMIREGRVTLNGERVTEMGVQADPSADAITVDGRRLPRRPRRVYILLNKPRNVVSTASDPEGRPTVLGLVRPDIGGRLYPVGRLDFASEGLLILTNDGDFTRFMTRAGGAPKSYRVKVSGRPSEAALARLQGGFRSGRTRYAPCRVRSVGAGSNAWLEVTLTEGRNREIRRMFEAIGHRVMRLRRTRIGFLEDSRLAPGEWRRLSAHEVREFYRLYSGAGPRSAGPRRDSRR